MRSSYSKLVSMVLAVGAGICLSIPALANDSTANSQGTLAQSQSQNNQNTTTSSNSNKGVSEMYQTGQKLSQAIKDTNALPGGWLCLNNPNSQCLQQSK